MKRCSARDGYSWNQRLAGAVVLAILLTVGFSPSIVSAQGAKSKKAAPEAEKKTGKIASVEKKGKAATLTIELEDGGKLEVLVTAKLPFSVSGPGDAGYLQPKVFISSDSVIMSNNELFGRQFTVHLGNNPPPQAKKDATADVYHVCGQIVSADNESMTVNFGTAGTKKVSFEQGANLTVAVQSTDPDLAAEGAAVEVEGTTRGAKFLPSKVSVTLEKMPAAEEVFAGDKKGAKAKATATAKPSATPKKSGKTSKDEPSGDPIGKASDPFGVLNGKDAKGKTGDKKDGEKDKKDGEKKE